jgi:preprotein translocase subunit SecA
MQHLETMDHLRDSVRLRGYGQREPLVEYKREGYEQFQRLIAEINKQIAYTVFRVTVQVQEQPVVPVEGVQLSSSQGNERGSASADAAASTTGRNDPCPCGSGKKYKKCGLLNTPEHQQLMAKKA